MGLKMLSNGQYEVKTLKDAKAALEGMVALEAEISELMKEHGIDEMMQDAAEMKRAAQAFCAAKEIDRVDLDGCHFTLIKQAYDSRFIATDDDLNGAEPADRKIVPLRKIIRKKFGPFGKGKKSSEIWKRITKPTVVKEALDEVVAEGLLTVDEIAPSFVEKQKAPYLRRFNDDT
jgi:hypothetical protein